MSQLELSLPAPAAAADEPLVPARMINEFVYCPRLAYLEWVEGQWADSGDTAEGRRAHARVDARPGRLPEPDALFDEAPPFTARSVELSSERLGLVARMDVIHGDDGRLTLVEHKKGRRPHVKAGAWEPERVQMCVQALVCEDNGYVVEAGFLWFAEGRERVPVAFDEALRATTLKAAADLRLTAAARRPPPPLENSPKCPRCSLLPLCLPDEVNWFRDGASPRPLPPPADTALPLYVQTPGARVGKSGEELVVTCEGEAERRIPIDDVSELVLAGPVSLTTPAVNELIRRGRPIAWMSTGFWFLGSTGAEGPRSAAVRQAQFARMADDRFRLDFARGLVGAKIRNSRTLLRRNGRGDATERDATLLRLKHLAAKAAHAPDIAVLLGLEGEAAATYFRAFPSLFTEAAGALPAFRFQNRNRRPPADPVNACLSLAYSLLARHLTAALQIAGLDPWAGLYHAMRPGKPALALDLMEPYRPIIADSVVLTVINQGEVGPDDFLISGPGCALKTHARRRFIAAFERRLDHETTHPVFGYRLSLRRLAHVQARLLARHLLGETQRYIHYEPR